MPARLGRGGDAGRGDRERGPGAEGGEARGKGMRRLRAGGWFVCVLRCADGTLYTGITRDVGRRCRQHNAGTASRYTRSRRPVRAVYREAHPDRGSALRREAAVKALSRQEKQALVRQARQGKEWTP